MKNSKLRQVLEKLFRLGLVKKEDVKKNDYDLLLRLLKSRRRNKKKLDSLYQKNAELTAFINMLSDKDIVVAYSNKELQNVLSNLTEK